MIETPTRRVILGASIFAAGSLLINDGSVAQAPLAPTQACHDGHEATLPQTEGPYFKPSSPERIELLDIISGQRDGQGGKSVDASHENLLGGWDGLLSSRPRHYLDGS